MRPSSNREKKASSDTYRVVCMYEMKVWVKVEAHNSLEPPLEYNQDQMPFMNHGLLWHF